MKLIIASHCLITLCFLYALWPSTSSQYFENPKIFYKPMTFDSVLRGQYNISQCIKDLLECFEYMRADIICDARWNWRHETYCGYNKMFCLDQIGYHMSIKHRFLAFSGDCHLYTNWPTWNSWRGRWT